MSSKSKGMKRRKMWGKIGIPSRVKARKKLCKRTLGNFFGGIFYCLPLLMCEHGVQFMFAVSICIIPKVKESTK